MSELADAAYLRSRRVLVVEDEYMVAEDMQMELESLGAEVIGPAASVDEALAMLGENEVEFAIIDVNLGGELAFPVADALKTRGVHFVFTTGYDQSALPLRYAGFPRCEKPIDMRRLTALLMPQKA